MRYFVLLTVFLTLCTFLSAEDKADPKLDKALIDSLRVVHDRGGDLYNAGDYAAGYRMYQGGLIVAKGLMPHRPGLSRMIDDGLEAADKQATTAKRAFQLHELIEKVRTELQSAGPAPVPELPSKKGETPKKIDDKDKEKPKEKPVGEYLTTPPRDVTPKKNDNPPGKIGEIDSGVIGRVIVAGKFSKGVDVTFHATKGEKTYTATSGPEGVFTVANLPLGMYKITLKPTAESKAKIAASYQNIETTLLRFELEKPGEKFDVVLE